MVRPPRRASTNADHPHERTIRTRSEFLPSFGLGCHGGGRSLSGCYTAQFSVDLGPPVALRAAGVPHAAGEPGDGVVPAAGALERRVVGWVGLVAPAGARVALVHVVYGGRLSRRGRSCDRGDRTRTDTDESAERQAEAERRDTHFPSEHEGILPLIAPPLGAAAARLSHG